MTLEDIYNNVSRQIAEIERRGAEPTKLFVSYGLLMLIDNAASGQINRYGEYLGLRVHTVQALDTKFRSEEILVVA